MQDVHFRRRVIVYRQSKIAGPEGEAVLIPREVFDVDPTLLDNPRRKSLRVYLDAWRPKLLNRALHRYGPAAEHDYVWCGPDGLPQEPEKYRQTYGALAKTAWPGFYPYLERELGIIMRALQIIRDRGALDLEILVQWTAHEKLDTLRRYTRKARQILREAGGKPARLNELLQEWNRV